MPEIVHHFALNETNMGKEAHIWQYEKRVLARVSKLLNSAEYADVFQCYRRSAALAEIPLLLQYMAAHDTWRFITPRLVANTIVYWKIRRHFPQALVDLYVNLRSRRV